MELSRTELLNEFCYGWLEDGRWQLGLLEQLQRDLSAIKSSKGDGPSGSKPKSKPPLNLADMDFYYECCDEVQRVSSDEDCPLGKLDRLRSRARVMLGYDVGVMQLPSVSCPQCGGALEVARDASSAVVCVERCGIEYPTSSWLELLQQKEAG